MSSLPATTTRTTTTTSTRSIQLVDDDEDSDFEFEIELDDSESEKSDCGLDDMSIVTLESKTKSKSFPWPAVATGAPTTTSTTKATKSTESSLKMAVQSWKNSNSVTKETVQDTQQGQGKEDEEEEKSLVFHTDMEVEMSEALRRIQKRVETIGNECKCCLCLEILVKATVLSPCGHSFCKDCFFASKVSKCPICRQGILAYAPNVLADNVIATIVTSCSPTTVLASNHGSSPSNKGLDERAMGSMAFTADELETYYQRTGAYAMAPQIHAGIKQQNINVGFAFLSNASKRFL